MPASGSVSVPMSGPVSVPMSGPAPSMPYGGVPSGGVPHGGSGGVPQPLSGPSTQPNDGAAWGAVSGPVGSGGVPQSFSQPVTAPYPPGLVPSGPTAAADPHAAYGAHAAHSSGPYPGGPMQVPPPPAWAGGPPGGGHAPPGGGHAPHREEIPGSQFVEFLKISAKRAFRLRIEPNEVLPEERRSLAHASPPITDVNLQAFLAWRRSVLFLIACALVPLSVIGLIDAYRSRDWQGIFFVRFAPALAETLFCYLCWSQLKRWAHWRTQRRKLFYGWLLFMITPFIVFIYPLNTFFLEIGRSLSSSEKRAALAALGIDGVYRQAVMPFVFSMLAMLQLAPKAISLMPGLIRSSMVIKLLFPGVSAPGWLIVMASPMYALLAYVILIIPYQFTGSGWFIAGILGVVAGQAVLARAGFGLARPMTEEEALVQIKKVRRYYVTVMTLSAVLIVVALGSLVSKLNLRATDVILAVLKFETNVLTLTMIGADLVVTNLDKARHYTRGRDQVEEHTENKIAAFVSFSAPPPPPT